MDFLTKWIFFAIMIRVFYYLIIFTISFFLSLSLFSGFNVSIIFNISNEIFIFLEII